MAGRLIVLSSLVVTLALAATGCATKKYVRTNVEPLEARLGTVEQTTQEHESEIKRIDQRVESGLSDAISRADSAARSAESAGQEARNAKGLAEQGLSKVATVEGKLANVHNYQVFGNATVRFDFNSAELSDEARQELDRFAESFKGRAHFLVEIQGFTDTVGEDSYNIQLSNRRAEAVARYLTAEHGIPLAKIAMLGYGKAMPAADNKTRDGRKLNRRVELRVLTPQLETIAQQASPSSATAQAQ
jgi:outer membrane protein OmpA-like peptidoglycan-associated protein